MLDQLMFYKSKLLNEHKDVVVIQIKLLYPLTTCTLLSIYYFSAEIILPLPIGRGGRKVVAFIVDFVSHYPNLFQLARN